jgi:hypothetical protein
MSAVTLRKWIAASFKMPSLAFFAALSVPWAAICLQHAKSFAQTINAVPKLVVPAHSYNKTEFSALLAAL